LKQAAFCVAKIHLDRCKNVTVGGLMMGGPTQPPPKKTSGGLTLGGPTQTKKTMGGGLDASE